MSNQSILDQVEDGLPLLPIDLREKILNAVWEVLSDNRQDEEDEA